MQGWSPDFIPKITGDAVDMKVIDRILTIAGPEAMKCSKELAQREGIFVGITAGATFAGALKVAADAPKGANILAMLPDTGERYLSTPLFADIPADMTEEGARRSPVSRCSWRGILAPFGESGSSPAWMGLEGGVRGQRLALLLGPTSASAHRSLVRPRDAALGDAR